MAPLLPVDSCESIRLYATQLDDFFGICADWNCIVSAGLCAAQVPVIVAAAGAVPYKAGIKINDINQKLGLAVCTAGSHVAVGTDRTVCLKGAGSASAEQDSLC